MTSLLIKCVSLELCSANSGAKLIDIEVPVVPPDQEISAVTVVVQFERNIIGRLWMPRDKDSLQHQSFVEQQHSVIVRVCDYDCLFVVQHVQWLAEVADAVTRC